MDPQTQLRVAYLCLVRAGAQAEAQARGGSEEWSQAAAALQDAHSLLGLGSRSGVGSPPAVAGQRQSCDELIRAALAALRALAQQQDWLQATDASWAALVALELVDGQLVP